jgi:hypothetical protein
MQLQSLMSYHWTIPQHRQESYSRRSFRANHKSVTPSA